MSHLTDTLLDPIAPRTQEEGTAISLDETTIDPPPNFTPAEMVELLEAHLANVNTQLALNTMALAAFGLTTTALPDPTTYVEEQ